LSFCDMEVSRTPSKDLLDEETVFELEDSLDALPLTPLSRKNDADSEASLPSLPSSRRDSRIKPETMLSRVSAFASVSEEIVLEDLFEYIWPNVDAEDSPAHAPDEAYYVVQELLADFLKECAAYLKSERPITMKVFPSDFAYQLRAIKSFKRRYPDLSRRVMDAYERTWLQNNGLVPAGRAELGLTALRSEEVMTLLQNDFPDVHVAVSDLFRQRRFQKLADLQKRQYEAARIERGEARAEAARKRALESASDFNRQLLSERHRERCYYWDLQTMQIHVPKLPYRLIPEEVVLQQYAKKGGAYPVAVIPGQFNENFVDFSSTELSYLPLSRALYTTPCRKPRVPTPLPTTLRYGNLCPLSAVGTDNKDATEAVQSSLPGTGTPASLNLEQKSSTASAAPRNDSPFKTEAHGHRYPKAANGPIVTEQDAKPASVQNCSVCRQPVVDPLRCSECGRAGHPSCLELPPSMIDVVRTYAWSCMECKQCVECQDSGNGEQMMFCDRCDRGYHAFCVGLSGIPDGNWECPTCAPLGSTKTVTANSRRSSSVAVSTPIKQSSSCSASRVRSKRHATSKSGKRVSAKRADTGRVSPLVSFDESSCATEPEEVSTATAAAAEESDSLPLTGTGSPSVRVEWTVDSPAK
uniref:PHD finger protein 10 n=1 Tax=Schistocephalus solidus TaxID=70667 RepID=A0A183T9Z0_SCHSO